MLPPEGDGYSVTLERQSDGRCTHEIPRTCSGTYALHLIRSGPDGTVREETDTAAVMGWSPEYDLLIEDEERAGLLFAMCDITGGETGAVISFIAKK